MSLAQRHLAMIEVHPTLRQQIEAVEWAAQHIDDALKEYEAALAAAIETLKTMEFAREVLK